MGGSRVLLLCLSALLAIQSFGASALPTPQNAAQEEQQLEEFRANFQGTLPKNNAAALGKLKARLKDLSKSLSGLAGKKQKRKAEELVKETNSDGSVLKRLVPTAQSKLLRIVECSMSTFESAFEHIDIRKVSNQYMDGGKAVSSLGLSNLVWGWGQFIDHDVTLTTDASSDPFTIELDAGGVSSTMTVHRLLAEPDTRNQCREPINFCTPAIDAGPVYGTQEDFLKSTLRDKSCFLRVTPGSRFGQDFLPLTNFDDSINFIAGDLRVNEHAVLTSIHTIWLREHNRLCRIVNRHGRTKKLSDDAKFDLVRKTVISKIQRITIKEYLPALGISEEEMSQMIKPSALDWTDAVSVEFAAAAYRFGHDMVPDNMGSIKTVDLFGGEKYLLQRDGKSRKPKYAGVMDKVFKEAASNLAAEVDGQLSNTLRNMLFGVRGLDLAAFNIFRGRELGVATYETFTKLFGTTFDASLDQNMDAFIALLKESNAKPEEWALPDTARSIIMEQFHRILYSASNAQYMKPNGWNKYFLGKEIEEATLQKVINANTNAKVHKNCMYVPGVKGNKATKKATKKTTPSQPSGTPTVKFTSMNKKPPPPTPSTKTRVTIGTASVATASTNAVGQPGAPSSSSGTPGKPGTASVTIIGPPGSPPTVRTSSNGGRVTISSQSRTSSSSSAKASKKSKKKHTPGKYWCKKGSGGFGTPACKGK